MKNSARIRYMGRAAGMLTVASILVLGLVAQPVAQQAAQENVSGERVVMEKTDPATGARWVLMCDAASSGGPGRWVLAEAGMGSGAFSAKRPVIRSGDRIVVEEQTAVSEAWLEATALTSAGAGGDLRARIAIGERTVTVRAIAAGRAELKETGR